MHPREQNGALSSDDGLPQTGQAFGFTRHRRRTWAARRRRASRRRRRPGGRALRASRRAAPAAAMIAGCATSRFAPLPLDRRAPQQRPRLEGGAVLRQLEQRGMASRTDDLQEAEAVDRGALERLRQRSRRSPASTACALRLARQGREVDADRAADAVAADRARRGLRAGQRELGRRQVPVDVDQGHRRGRRHAQLAAGEADDAAARFLDQVGPACLLEPVVGRGEGQRRAP